jgi:signal peptidase
VALLALATAIVVVPKVTHGAALTVLTGSMEPTISPGDIAVVRGVTDPINEVKVGDIITYLPYPDDPTLITHRVIGLSSTADGETLFVTQGDANSAVDDPVGAHQIRGRHMYTVPYLGYITHPLAGHASWIVTATGVALILIALFWIFGPSRGRSDHDPQRATKTQRLTTSTTPARRALDAEADTAVAVANANTDSAASQDATITPDHPSTPEPSTTTETAEDTSALNLRPAWAALPDSDLLVKGVTARRVARITPGQSLTWASVDWTALPNRAPTAADVLVGARQ